MSASLECTLETLARASVAPPVRGRSCEATVRTRERVGRGAQVALVAVHVDAERAQPCAVVVARAEHESRMRRIGARECNLLNVRAERLAKLCAQSAARALGGAARGRV